MHGLPDPLGASTAISGKRPKVWPACQQGRDSGPCRNPVGVPVVLLSESRSCVIGVPVVSRSCAMSPSRCRVEVGVLLAPRSVYRSCCGQHPVMAWSVPCRVVVDVLVISRSSCCGPRPCRVPFGVSVMSWSVFRSCAGRCPGRILPCYWDPKVSYLSLATRKLHARTRATQSTRNTSEKSWQPYSRASGLRQWEQQAGRRRTT